jgi:hypothetical protein
MIAIGRRFGAKSGGTVPAGTIDHRKINVL